MTECIEINNIMMKLNAEMRQLNDEKIVTDFDLTYHVSADNNPFKVKCLQDNNASSMTSTIDSSNLYSSDESSKNSKLLTHFTKSFEIETMDVFSGDQMPKRFSTNFSYKKRVVWINPISLSIHWGKHRNGIDLFNDSKFIILNNKVSPKSIHFGTCKGVCKYVELDSKHGEYWIVIHTKNNDYLELEVPKHNYLDWIKVLKEILPKKAFLVPC